MTSNSRRISERLALAASAIALAALTAPSAHAASTPTYTVDVTGIHVVDWRYQTDNYPDECKAWVKGSGTATLGIRTTKPARYMLLAFPGMAPQLLMSKLGRYAGVAQRTASDWEDHAIPQTSACTPCGPLSEYGECSEPGPPLAPLHDCRRRNGIASAAVSLIEAGKSRERNGPAALVDALRVDTSVVARFPSCPPTQLTEGPGMRSENAREVSIVGPKVRRIRRLARGQKITLHGSVERSFAGGRETQRCSKPAGGAGYSECAVTDVTVEIKRVA
ncbi:hypothetical protein [Conexibacter woesei]|uniref:Uncharacterized protein n=1 Tax=Conexibacter woesei (strain DSM 14684 / CCUG 47730 / CIP 108061 / JCM 11494 / NBRC 100937 / ID131577) TaxID=469383 RepID=D3EYY5_CONWI|nr:hypothetical protein [Conexibacter woesei]ADB49859.1 hypothetical protein Cwoe_1431 [Conexibacter woesei DSM 14684]